MTAPEEIPARGSPAKRRFIGGLLLLVAWGAAFAAGLRWFSPEPELRIPWMREVSFVAITPDSRTLLAMESNPGAFFEGTKSAGRVFRFDLETGTVEATTLQHEGLERPADFYTFEDPPDILGNHLCGWLSDARNKSESWGLFNWRTGVEIERISGPREDVIALGSLLMVKGEGPDGRSRWRRFVPSPGAADPQGESRGAWEDVHWFAALPPASEFLASQDGRVLLAKSAWDDTVSWYDMASGRRLGEVSEKGIASLSPEGDRVAHLTTWQEDGKCTWRRVWRTFDVTTGRMLFERAEVRQTSPECDHLYPPPAEATHLRLLDQERALVAYCVQPVNWGSGLRLCESIAVCRVDGPQAAPFDVATNFHIVPSRPLDGRAAGSIVGNERVIDAATGMQRDFPSHLFTLEPSPDGRWLLAMPDASPLRRRIEQWTGFDLPEPESLLLLDLQRPARALSLQPEAGPSLFSADGQSLVTRTLYEILVWRLPPGRPWKRAAVWSFPILLAGLVWFVRRRRRENDRSEAHREAEDHRLAANMTPPPPTGSGS